jgi:hypothetical protein
VRQRILFPFSANQARNVAVSTCHVRDSIERLALRPLRSLFISSCRLEPFLLVG